jgi:hypothetical protein
MKSFISMTISVSLQALPNLDLFHINSPHMVLGKKGFRCYILIVIFVPIKVSFQLTFPVVLDLGFEGFVGPGQNDYELPQMLSIGKGMLLAFYQN